MSAKPKAVDQPSAEDVAKARAFWGQFDSDPSLDEDGAWVEIDGVGVKIRSKISIRVQNKLAQLYRPLKGAYDDDVDVPPDLDREMNCRWVAEAIIADWRPPDHPKGMWDPDNLGQRLPYSQANAIRICQLPQYYRFVLRCLTESSQVANYRTRAARATAGNS